MDKVIPNKNSHVDQVSLDMKKDSFRPCEEGENILGLEPYLSAIVLFYGSC
jgi:hypothetical protein